MIDREKVIRGLECCLSGPMQCDSCPYKQPEEFTGGCAQELKGDAIALLKEQEPVEPDAILTNPVCGVCHDPLDVTDEYCRHCGRAVKWRV